MGGRRATLVSGLCCGWLCWLQPQVGMVGGGGKGRGRQCVSGHPSCPGNYMHSPGSPGVTAWTKAQRGCQLVLAGLCIQVPAPRSKAHWHVPVCAGPQLTGSLQAPLL